MTSIISSVSGQFSKSLLLGTFLPVVLFLVLAQMMVGTLGLDEIPVLAGLREFDTQWKVVAFALVAFVLSLALYNFNIPIVRWYEGYPWKDWLIGEKRAQRYRAIRAAYDARWRGMRTLLRRLDDTHPHYAEIYQLWDPVCADNVNDRYPGDDALVLPTRLGNVIRSFEDYPYRRYGMEGITLWPRLVATIEKEYLGVIDEAKTSFNFVLNCSLLSLFLAVISLADMVYDPRPLDDAAWLLWLAAVVARTVAFCVLARWLYILSIDRAQSWGVTVRGAFDLYRWKLLQQLGYKQTPATQTEERALWYDIYDRMAYRDERLPPARYSADTTIAFPTPTPDDPAVVQLSVSRAMLPTAVAPASVVITVANVDQRGWPAAAVVVRDSVLSGFAYVWGSERCRVRVVAPVPSGGPPAPAWTPRAVRLTGSNPYQFEIGSLEHGEVAVLTYCVQKSGS